MLLQFLDDFCISWFVLVYQDSGLIHNSVFSNQYITVRAGMDVHTKIDKQFKVRMQSLKELFNIDIML